MSKRGELTKRGESSYKGGTGVFFLPIHLILYLGFQKFSPGAGFSGLYSIIKSQDVLIHKYTAPRGARGLEPCALSCALYFVSLHLDKNHNKKE